MNILFSKRISEDKTKIFCNADASADSNDDADTGMLMPRFPNGLDKNLLVAN